MSHHPYPVTSDFGPRATGFHTGVDLGTPVGTLLGVPFDGVIDNRKLTTSYGWHSWVRSGRYEYLAAHCSALLLPDGYEARAGENWVETGGTEGASGSGNSTGPHVHYEVRRSGSAIDPMSYLGMLFHAGEEDDLTDEEKEALDWVMKLKASTEKVNSNASFPEHLIPAHRQMAAALAGLEPDSNFTFPGPVVKFVRSHPKNADGTAKH